MSVAVAGCGFYAQNHLHSWSDLATEGAVLIAVCDRDAEKAKAAGQKFGVPWYTDAATLMEVQRPDLFDIVTRQDSHAELLSLALANDCAAMVQKPLAADWKSCLQMARAAAESDNFVGVHENFRFQSPILRLRRLVENGAIGTPRAARIRFTTGFDVFAAQPYLRSEARLIIQDLGVHLLDLSRALMGEVGRLTCETQKRRDDTQGEDTAFMLLRHENGGVTQIECSFHAKPHRDSFPETLIEIEGDAGMATLHPGGRIEVTSRGLAWTEDAASPLLDWTERPWHVTQESVLNLNRHVLAAWRDGRAPETAIIDNIMTCALVEAAYRSAATGSSIAPPQVRPGEIQ